MQNFYIIANTEKKDTYGCAHRIKEYLLEKGRECWIYGDSGSISNDSPQEYRGVKHRRFRYTDVSKIPDTVECVIVLGGDGTIIQAARDLKDREIPILGINMGTLGYLAELDTSSIIPALDAMMNDCYFIEERLMLSGQVIRSDEIIHEDVALNDIVLSRSGNLRVIRFDIFVDGEYLNHYRADGMIIATPTGSTAYNLSAGGPIIMPTSDMIVLTPISPHTLNARSIVLPSNVVIEIHVKHPDGMKDTIPVSNFDADAFSPLQNGDVVRIAGSEKKAKLVKISKISFLETLRRKMADQ